MTMISLAQMRQYNGCGNVRNDIIFNSRLGSGASPPTFLMTLSCVDLRWNELISIIATLQGVILTNNDINETYFLIKAHFLI